MAALDGLLREFRHGKIIAASAEAEAMERHVSSLSWRWNNRFPGFPADDFPYVSLRGVLYRRHRDAHLKDIIVQFLANRRDPTAIVNPACVFGRHARHLAARLLHVKVIAADIYPRCFQTYRLLRLGDFPTNFNFVRDNIFAPRLDVQPTAVVFFGACGSLSDAALDYAINSRAQFVMCRTCCHDNIGGNVTITPRPYPVNRLFRLKNLAFSRVKKSPKYTGHYFSPAYSPSTYPRSAAGKRLSSSDEFMALARDSADSDICRAIIDLDRHLYLAEHGFYVESQGDLLVAELAEHADQPGSSNHAAVL